MIALDKQPGVRLVGVGETWRHLIAKIVLKVTGPEATMACQDDKLCAGIKAGIDGDIHKVQAIWDENSTTEESGVLLIDAKDAFNEIDRVRIPCMVRRLWPSGACFVFNCCCHWSSLFLRNGNGTAGFLYIREGVT